MPEPVSILSTENGHIEFYTDGEYVEVFGSDVCCSKHGVLNRAHAVNMSQCTHGTAFDEEGNPTVPTYDLSEFSGLVLNDSRIRQRAVENESIQQRVLEAADGSD